MTILYHAEELFSRITKLNKLRKRKLPKGRKRREYEDELEIQIQERFLVTDKLKINKEII